MTLAASDLTDSLGRAWPAFVLVAALLLLGLVAERGGVFRWAGERLERLPGPPLVLAVGCLVIVAAVTAVLNLDTAVVFVTPVVVHAVRRRGLDPAPIAYATLVMANASSLLLPGANLTNLIVRGEDPVGGARWLVEIAPAGLAAAVVSAVVLLVRDRAAWRVPGPAAAPAAAAPAAASAAAPAAAPAGRPPAAAAAEPPDAHAAERSAGRPGAVAVGSTLLAGALIVVLPEPALPVLAVALAAVLVEAARGRVRVPEAVRAVGPGVLAALLALVVLLGWLARRWDGPARLVADLGPLASAAVAAVSSVLVNNLPAAALLTAGRPAEPEGLLVGLNLGPNLFFTGSLATYLWWRACRGAGVPVTLRGLATRAPLTAVPAILVAVLVLP